jgi:hypothetical protein
MKWVRNMPGDQKIIILAIIVINVAALVFIRSLPIPPKQWAEVYYSKLMFDQFLVNVFLCIISACLKKWAIAATFLAISLIPLLGALV